MLMGGSGFTELGFKHEAVASNVMLACREPLAHLYPLARSPSQHHWPGLKKVSVLNEYYRAILISLNRLGGHCYRNLDFLLHDLHCDE